MFVIFLKFSDNKANAAQFMDAHKAWVKRGFQENIFLVAGSLQPGLGGAIISHNSSIKALEQFVQQDPFVIENIVEAEVFEITPNFVDDRLNFLMS